MTGSTAIVIKDDTCNARQQSIVFKLPKEVLIKKIYDY